jgi:hypothetical protein
MRCYIPKLVVLFNFPFLFTVKEARRRGQSKSTTNLETTTQELDSMTFVEIIASTSNWYTGLENTGPDSEEIHTS